MSYKKLVSLFAVSALALGACGADDADDTDSGTDDTEQTEEGTDSGDLINQAKEDSGEAFPEYGIEVLGVWTEDGWAVEYVPGQEGTIPVSAITEAEEYYVYLVEDGVIAEVVANEPEVEFVVDSPSADVDYLVGISPEEVGSEGDEVTEEAFPRHEKIIFVEGEESAEEEE